VHIRRDLDFMLFQQRDERYQLVTAMADREQLRRRFGPASLLHLAIFFLQQSGR
jgi:hypothetical protein